MDELNAYTLMGDARTLSSTSSLCPNIKTNCCGIEDHAQIKKYYLKDRKRQQIFHSYILFIHRWIYGFGKEFYMMADQLARAYDKRKKGFAGNIYWVGDKKDAKVEAGKQPEPPKQ